ncbi:MAG TPA: hypothetical protein VNT51_09210 [Miltoncostaeaceae bacterium]|nr:hypothetical protein [Miltoncostaeaceae bacterium]
MSGEVVLPCPLCGAVAHRGGEPEPGACPVCGAAFAGGEDHPIPAAAAALALWDVTGIPDRALADGLFALLPGEPLARRAAIVSDRRAGFYRWWVFAAAGEDRPALMAEVAARAPARRP